MENPKNELAEALCIIASYANPIQQRKDPVLFEAARTVKFALQDFREAYLIDEDEDLSEYDIDLMLP